jgi:spermidine synthase
LEAHGIFCQWLPLHQLDLDTLRSIVASFIAVYPQGTAMLASNSLETPVLGLIGRNDDQRFDMEVLAKHIADVSLPPRLSNIGIEDEFALLGSFVAGPASLHRFAALAALNTDDRPVVTYRAPRITYAPDSLPGERLIELLQELFITSDELINAPGDLKYSDRLTAYWRARNQFIAAGRDVHPSADVQRMLAQVREPLLAELRISPDFRPAYDPLLRMAAVLSRTNTDQARDLLSELVQIQPARTEAHSLLGDISSSP